jgi:uncharacterized protein
MLRWVAVFIAVSACAGETAYQAAIAKWRRQKDVELRADNGWLTVTGLFWLKEGENRVGGAPGLFELHGVKTVFRPDHGVPVEMTAKTTITDGPRTFSLIERGGTYGVRLKDNKSRQRTEFKGQHWFPARESYRVFARFIAYPQAKQVPIVNILGNKLQMPSPGYAIFNLDGRELRLEPVVEEGEKELFFIFRDQTAGRETYGAGRFLYTALPREGKVELDFNKAENPPCAFTPFATCPLPPPQNILPLRIEAGELAARH